MACSSLSGLEEDRVNLRFFFDLEKKGKLEVVKYCMSVGLVASNYTCPNCNENMKLVERKDVDDGYGWVCRVYGNNRHYVKRSALCGGGYIKKIIQNYLIRFLMQSAMFIRRPHTMYLKLRRQRGRIKK